MLVHHARLVFQRGQMSTGPIATNDVIPITVLQYGYSVMRTTMLLAVAHGQTMTRQ
jgi:hypothetical protein